MNRFNIRIATLSDLRELGELFDGYRRFYLQASDIERARDFISERMNRNDSWLLVAEQGESLIGFCQLYPSFSSTQMRRIAILNDLYVSESSRAQGVGKALMQAAEKLGRNLGLGHLELATATDNAKAQRLYEKMGWLRDTAFYYYGKSLDS